jgi:hypothetical protein
MGELGAIVFVLLILLWGFSLYKFRSFAPRLDGRPKEVIKWEERSKRSLKQGSH